MIKLQVNGQERTKEHNEKAEKCKMCLNGDKFKDYKVYKTDCFAGEYTQQICEKCHSLYKIPYLKLDLKPDTLRGIRVTPDNIKNFNDEVLTMENADKHLVKIAVNYQNKADELEQKSECDGHRMIESYPFKTAEGRFTIQSCLDCKTSMMNYKGIPMSMPLSQLVNFVATQGINYEQAQQKATEITLDWDTPTELDWGTELFADVPVAQTDTTPVMDWGL